MSSDAWFEDDSPEEGDLQIAEYDITASPNDFNIKTLYDFVKSGVVIIPGFQRHYVWDVKQASKLIESIIMGLPIPQIFLYEENRNRFLVIDGQQRLMSIYYFISERFPRKEKRTELREMVDRSGEFPAEVLEDDNFFTDFTLNLPANIPGQANRLHKLRYSSLGDLKTTFDLRTIRNIIIKQSSPTDDHSSIYEIFHRLNTGGVNLRPQEIRTSLYHSKFLSMLYRINSKPQWRRLTGVEKPDLHMKDIEFLLRGYALLVDSDSYAPSMVKFLNSFSSRCRRMDQAAVDYLEQLFQSFLDSCDDLPERAFYGKSSKFTISIYDAVFAAVCDKAFREHTLIVEKVSCERLLALKEDHEFGVAIQSQTSATKNVHIRLERAKSILQR